MLAWFAFLNRVIITLSYNVRATGRMSKESRLMVKEPPRGASGTGQHASRWLPKSGLSGHQGHRPKANPARYGIPKTRPIPQQACGGGTVRAMADQLPTSSKP